MYNMCRFDVIVVFYVLCVDGIVLCKLGEDCFRWVSVDWESVHSN